jgi:hypothetical protein
MLMSGLLDPQTQMPRTRLFWAVLGAMIFAQLVALWLLCSHQVRKAEARQTEVTVHQLALADCLQYVPGATIATCTSRIAAATPQIGGATSGGVMPVGYSR